MDDGIIVTGVTKTEHEHRLNTALARSRHGWVDSGVVDTRAATHSQAGTAKFGRDLRVTLLKPMY